MAVSWLVPKRLLVKELVRSCRDLRNVTFAAALKAEYKKALPFDVEEELTCDCTGGEHPELALSLNDSEQESLVAILAKISSLKTLVVEFNTSDFDELSMLQDFINSLLLAAPQIQELQLSTRSDGSFFCLNADFLGISRVPAVKKIELKLDSRWDEALLSLCSPLRRCEEVVFSTSQLRPVVNLSYPDLCAALVQEGSVVQLLKVSDARLWESNQLLDHVTRAMTTAGCTMKALYLQIGRQTTTKTFRSFCAAIEATEILELLSLKFDAPDLDLLSLCLAPALGWNRSIRALRLRGIRSLNFFTTLALSLGFNQTLALLDLSGSTVLGDEFASFLTKVLRRQARPVLTNLLLARTSIGDAGVKELISLPLQELDIRGSNVSKEYLIPMLLAAEGDLPNICLDELALSTALQLARSLGRESILVYGDEDVEMRQVLHLNMSSSCPGIVPNCFCSTKEGDDIVELLSSHAQLKHIWYLGCTSHYLPSDHCGLVLMHLTFNRKIPVGINQMIQSSVAMDPNDWLTALSAIANEPLDWIYYLVSKWRMEGTERRNGANGSVAKKRRRTQLELLST